MTSPIDRALAKARLESDRYTEEEMEAAEIRVAARVADRVLLGALCFDDAIQGVRERSVPRPGPSPEATAPRAKGLREEARRDLRVLCQTVVGQDDALHQMSSFVGSVLEPIGARVLGCVLHLAERQDSAQFWWQFAAGAGDTAAAYCLYLHHMALGEVRHAEWWHSQANPDHNPHASQPLMDEHDLVHALGEHTVALGECKAATRAVIDYVPSAVRFVDDVDLPLPEPDFAERIEELASAT